MSPYETLLAQLGKLLEMELKPDGNHTCLLRLNNEIDIRLEASRDQGFLVTGALLGQVPPGKSREALFRHALMANHIPPPRYGTLAWSQTLNELILYDHIPFDALFAEKLQDYLFAMAKKGSAWKKALDTGVLPPLVL